MWIAAARRHALKGRGGGPRLLAGRLGHAFTLEGSGRRGTRIQPSYAVVAFAPPRTGRSPDGASPSSASDPRGGRPPSRSHSPALPRLRRPHGRWHGEASVGVMRWSHSHGSGPRRAASRPEGRWSRGCAVRQPLQETPARWRVSGQRSRSEQDAEPQLASLTEDGWAPRGPQPARGCCPPSR